MIEIKDASKVYKNGTHAMDHINLTIGDGEYLCIIGLSGAGKSTLLRSINRLNLRRAECLSRMSRIGSSHLRMRSYCSGSRDIRAFIWVIMKESLR